MSATDEDGAAPDDAEDADLALRPSSGLVSRESTRDYSGGDSAESARAGPAWSDGIDRDASVVAMATVPVARDRLLDLVGAVERAWVDAELAPWYRFAENATQGGGKGAITPEKCFVRGGILHRMWPGHPHARGAHPWPWPLPGDEERPSPDGAMRLLRNFAQTWWTLERVHAEFNGLFGDGANESTPRDHPKLAELVEQRRASLDSARSRLGVRRYAFPEWRDQGRVLGVSPELLGAIGAVLSKVGGSYFPLPHDNSRRACRVRGALQRAVGALFRRNETNHPAVIVPKCGYRYGYNPGGRGVTSSVVGQVQMSGFEYGAALGRLYRACNGSGAAAAASSRQSPWVSLGLLAPGNRMGW